MRGRIFLLLIVPLLSGIMITFAALNGRPSPTYMTLKVSLRADLVEQAQSMRTLFFVFEDASSPEPKIWVAYRERLKAPLSAPMEFIFRPEKIQLTGAKRQDVPASVHVKVRLDLDGLAGPDQIGDITATLSNQALGSQLSILLDTQVIQDSSEEEQKKWAELKAKNPKNANIEALYGFPDRVIFREMKSWGNHREIFQDLLKKPGV